MNIGRKIYYELSTGNVILEIGERQGDVIETTVDQDIVMYEALQPYRIDAIGVLEVTFGQNTANFAAYRYRIDVNQNPPAIIFDTANPIDQTVVAQISMQEQINNLQDAVNMLLGV